MVITMVRTRPILSLLPSPPLSLYLINKDHFEDTLGRLSVHILFGGEHRLHGIHGGVIGLLVLA